MAPNDASPHALSHLIDMKHLKAAFSDAESGALSSDLLHSELVGLAQQTSSLPITLPLTNPTLMMMPTDLYFPRLSVRPRQDTPASFLVRLEMIDTV